MIALNIQNETSKLRAVVLGTAEKNGAVPTAEAAYDPKSLEHIIAGTYPREEAMILEMNAFESVLNKYAVTVYRPEVIAGVNQIFAFSQIKHLTRPGKRNRSHSICFGSNQSEKNY